MKGGEARRDVQAGLRLQTDRLEHEAVAGSANEHVRAEARAGGRFGRCAAVAAGKSARRIGVGRWGDHRPPDDALICKSDVDADLVDRPDIWLGRTPGRRKGTGDVLAGSDNEPDPAFHNAVE